MGESDLDEYQIQVGDYTEWCGLMLELAIRFSGWPEEAVSKTILRFERRVVKWLKRKHGVVVAYT
jgi:hypothetical protein